MAVVYLVYPWNVRVLAESRGGVPMAGGIHGMCGIPGYFDRGVSKAGSILSISMECQSISGIPGYLDRGVPMAGGILSISMECQSISGIPGGVVYPWIVRVFAL